LPSSNFVTGKASDQKKGAKPFSRHDLSRWRQITQPKPGWGSNGEERSKRDGELITGFEAPRTKPSFADGQEVSGVRIVNTCPGPVVKIGFANSEDSRLVPQPTKFL